MKQRILNKQKLWKLLGYEPSPIQLAVHDSRARWRVNVQGRRSGKSYSAAKEILPYLLSPNKKIWVCAPSLDLADKIVREVKQDIMVKLKLPIQHKKEISGQMHYMRLAGLNSEIWAKSSERPESLVGEGIDALILEEASKIKKVVWEQYLRPTLSDKNGWALFTTTPEGFQNWIYELWQRGKSDDFPDWESWQHPSWESPFFKDDIEELKKTLTYETFQQEFGASFVSFSGRIYQFDRATHIRNIKYDPNLPTYLSIDFGYRVGCAVVAQVQQNSRGKDTIYIIDEIWEENIRTESLVQKIKKLPYPIVRYFGDPAGGNTQGQSGMSDLEIFRKNGIIVDYRKDRISRNIANGVTHLRTWIEDALGHAHLFVDKKCEKTIMSFENYRYPEKKADQKLKEEPLKDGINDHQMDACRYLVCNLFPIKSRQAGVIDW